MQSFSSLINGTPAITAIIIIVALLLAGLIILQASVLVYTFAVIFGYTGPNGLDILGNTGRSAENFDFFGIYNTYNRYNTIQRQVLESYTNLTQ